MKKKVLDTIADPDLAVYAVWVTVLGRLSPQALGGAARSGAKRLADPRVVHTLDAEVWLGAAYGRGLGLPEHAVAWDVYLLFDRTVRWDDAPPPPKRWMHQLSDAAAYTELQLDAGKLAEQVRELLAARTSKREDGAPAKVQ